MKKLIGLCAALLISTAAFGQGSALIGGGIQVFGPTGRPLAGATVTICTSTATGVPCSPTTTVYTDATLTTPTANPQTSDGLGNVMVYANPGTYKYTVTGSGISTTGQPFTAAVSGSGNVVAGSNNAFTGNNTHSGTETFDNINKVIYWDGSAAYPFTTAGLQAAIAAACSSNVPGRLIWPSQIVTGISSFISVSSNNCSIEGGGRYVSGIQASAGLNSAILNLAGNHQRLINVGVDGNRSDNGGANANTFDCVDVGSNSTDILIDGVRASNCRQQGILVADQDASIIIRNSEVDHDGSGSINLEGTAGISVSPGANGINRVEIGPGNLIHDNNSGIIAHNSSTTTANLTEYSVHDNYIWGNVNDDILTTADAAPGSQIFYPRIENNVVSCSGWGGVGTTFTAAPGCPGFLQNGSTVAPGGVGLDFITNCDLCLVHPIVSGNIIHDTVDAGIALVSQITSLVSTANSGGNTIVSWQSSAFGDKFSLTWKPGIYLLVNGIAEKLVSVASITSLTVAGNMGTLTNVTFQGPTFMYADVSSNQINIGGNAANLRGGGIYNQFADGNSFSANVMKGAAFEGMYINYSNYLTSTGDRAYNNDTSGTASPRNDGFRALGSYGNSFLGNVADDTTATPKQTVGFLVDTNSVNTVILSSSLYGTTAAVTDNGSNSQINTGTNITIPGAYLFNGNAANPASGTSGITNQSSVGTTFSSGGAFQFRVGGATISTISGNGSFEVNGTETVRPTPISLYNLSGVGAELNSGGSSMNLQFAGTLGLRNSAAPTVNVASMDTSGNFSSLSVRPTSAAGGDIGTTLLPYANLWLGTAATNNFKFQPAATAAQRVVSIPDPLGPENLALIDTITANVIPKAASSTTSRLSPSSITDNGTKVTSTEPIIAGNGYSTFLTSGTSWTSPVNLQATSQVKITLIGGGAAGGTSGAATVGDGGGAGCVDIFEGTATTLGLVANTAYTIAIGSAGAATTFNNGTITVTAGGGTAGSTQSSAGLGIGLGGVGGTCTNGTILVPGQPGQGAEVFVISTGYSSGQGGNTEFGAGGQPVVSGVVGNPGTGFGSGGSGGGAGTFAGGAGKAGAILIEITL